MAQILARYPDVRLKNIVLRYLLEIKPELRGMGGGVGGPVWVGSWRGGELVCGVSSLSGWQRGQVGSVRTREYDGVKRLE